MERIIKVIKNQLSENYKRNLRGDILNEQLEKLDNKDYLMEAGRDASLLCLLVFECINFSYEEIYLLLEFGDYVLEDEDNEEVYFNFCRERHYCLDNYDFDGDFNSFKYDALIALANNLFEEYYGLLLDFIHEIKNKKIKKWDDEGSEWIFNRLHYCDAKI